MDSLHIFMGMGLLKYALGIRTLVELESLGRRWVSFARKPNQKINKIIDRRRIKWAGHMCFLLLSYKKYGVSFYVWVCMSFCHN